LAVRVDPRVQIGVLRVRSFDTGLHQFKTKKALIPLAVAAACAAGPVWAQSGLTDMGILNGGAFSTPYGVSADGSVVVGVGIGDPAVITTYRGFHCGPVDRPGSTWRCVGPEQG